MSKPDRHFVGLRIIVTLVFTACLCSFSFAQSLSVQSPEDSLTVGSVFDFSITLKNSQTFEKAIFPDSTYFNNVVELVSSQHFKISNSSDSSHYTLQFFGVGDAVISPLPVLVVNGRDTTTIFTDAVSLAYKQTIASEEDPLKPIKPIFKFPGKWWPYLLAVFVLLVIGILVWYFFFRTNEVEEQHSIPIPVFKDPSIELERLLSDLKSDHQQKIEKDYKEFYSRLGDSVRWYVEEVYSIPALESTTREVLRYMDAFGADVELIKHTRKILNEADMAKFAKFKPSLDQSWNAFKEAEFFLERARVIDQDRINRKRSDFIKAHSIKNENEEVVHGMG